MLITDAISATGMPDGRYQLGPDRGRRERRQVHVEWQPRRKRAHHGSRGAQRDPVFRMDLRDAVQAATLNPARAVGLAGQHGVLAKGAAADFTVLSPAGEVLKTIVRGRVLGDDSVRGQRRSKLRLYKWI